jgi:hypothetical protein
MAERMIALRAGRPGVAAQPEMRRNPMPRRLHAMHQRFGLLVGVVVMVGLLPASASAGSSPEPKVITAAASDTSRPLQDLAKEGQTFTVFEEREERGKLPTGSGFAGDSAVQRRATNAIAAPIGSFEGLANSDNPFEVSPPDPNGEVGPNHFVEMVNVVLGVYTKTGTRLLGPTPIGALWIGFALPDCTDLSGDPVVVYDQLADRWILTQFTTRGPIYYNCVAISTSGDPTGSYYRYAFSTGLNFPDYPKYGVWPDAYFLSTREFAPDDSFAGIGAYALERKKMLKGDPGARAVSVILPPGSTPYLTGDGLLPSDLDGRALPPDGSPNYFVGTMDSGAFYGAPFDGINVFAFSVTWGGHPTGSFSLAAQLSVAAFDSIFPCVPNSRSCIAQPKTGNKVDILSYRQRPTFRLAYRNFGGYEALVTNQSVEARPGIAGVRWYELRRTGGSFSVYQQGTYAPADGIHRWMGSAAQDRFGNIGVGYSVSNGDAVYPGIRYSARLATDPLGELTLGEGVIVAGSGSQRVSGRWGDYTDMTVDPTDDCTFWYVNEYYATSSQRGWQTRIASFQVPGC